MTRNLPAAHHTSLENLIEGLVPRLFRVAYYQAGSPDLAEDAVQETILRYLRSQQEKPGRIRSPLGWCLRVVTRVARQQCAEEMREAPVAETGGDVAAESDPSESLQAKESREFVRRSLAELPQPERDALSLHVFGDLGVREVAAVLAVPKSTVHERIQRGLQMLRQKLTGKAAASATTAGLVLGLATGELKAWLSRLPPPVVPATLQSSVRALVAGFTSTTVSGTIATGMGSSVMGASTSKWTVAGVGLVLIAAAVLVGVGGFSKNDTGVPADAERSGPATTARSTGDERRPVDNEALAKENSPPREPADVEPEAPEARQQPPGGIEQVLPFALPAGNDDVANVRQRTARQTIDHFLTLVFAGKDEEACALCDTRKPICKQLGDIRSLVSKEKIRLVDAWAGEREAVAFTNTCGADHGRVGVLFITARKGKEEGARWKIFDLDFEDPDGLKGEIERFQKGNPDAVRELSPKQRLAEKTMREFLRRVVAAKDREALKLAEPKKVTRRTMLALRKMKDYLEITIRELHIDEEAVLAVTSAVVKDGRKETLVLGARWHKDKWLVNLMDFDLRARLASRVKEFRETYPSALLISEAEELKAER